MSDRATLNIRLLFVYISSIISVYASLYIVYIWRIFSMYIESECIVLNRFCSILYIESVNEIAYFY